MWGFLSNFSCCLTWAIYTCISSFQSVSNYSKIFQNFFSMVLTKVLFWNFGNLNFNDFVSFFFTWDSIGAKISKHYSSFKTLSIYSKLSPNFLLNGTHKSTVFQIFEFVILMILQYTKYAKIFKIAFHCTNIVKKNADWAFFQSTFYSKLFSQTFRDTVTFIHVQNNQIFGFICSFHVYSHSICSRKKSYLFWKILDKSLKNNCSFPG